MKSGQGIFIILRYHGVKAASPICSTSRLVRKALCIMDTLSCSAQMRILILATGSSAVTGREWGREEGHSAPTTSECTLAVSGKPPMFLQLQGDCPSFCMTPSHDMWRVHLSKGLGRGGAMMWPGSGNEAQGPLPQRVTGCAWAVLHSVVPCGAPPPNWENRAFMSIPWLGTRLNWVTSVDISETYSHSKGHRRGRKYYTWYQCLWKQWQIIK